LEDETSSVIAGASVALRTLADGSIRCSVDFEPKDAKAAFELFGRPGQPVAVAALKVGYGAKDDKPKASYADLGPLCREAIDLCGNATFQRWASQSLGQQGGDFATEEDCKAFILSRCGLPPPPYGSRKTLDANTIAAEHFKRLRKQFQEWVANGPD
jgi:hypothetical protein